MDHQARYCLSAANPVCPLLAGVDVDDRLALPLWQPDGQQGKRSPGAWRHVLLAGIPILLAATVAAVGIAALSRTAGDGDTVEQLALATSTTDAAMVPTEAVSATPVATPTPSPTTSPPPTATIASLPPTTTSVPAPKRYTVQPGDTYIGIARLFGVTLEALLAANQRTVQNMLHPGDSLLIP